MGAKCGVFKRGYNRGVNMERISKKTGVESYLDKRSATEGIRKN